MTNIVRLSNDLIVVLWMVWLLVWTGAAFFVKRIARKEPVASMLVERVPIVAGFVVFVMPQWRPAVLSQRFFGESPALALAALVLVCAGMFFAYWARAHLGRNWSGQVIVRVGHALVTSGPYRWVRHPIYSGMILALIGTALATGAPYGFIGLALITFGFLVRVRLEEALMRQTFRRRL
jgi:protein-S-isoprenylcysteine O-methyltransferase Ste14